jgi:catechol 2,3-dioxygenase-like lactoylglutathione lyase family enzyme
VLFARSARGDSVERGAWALVVFANTAGAVLAGAFVWLTGGREPPGLVLLLLFLAGAVLTLRRRPAAKEAAGAPELFGLGAVLPVRDVDASVAYYRDVLGFTVDFVMGQPSDHGSVTRNRVGIQFTRIDTNGPTAAYAGWTYAFVNGIDRLFEEYESRGVRITQDLASRDHGMREFEIADLNGHRLRFGQYM